MSSPPTLSSAYIYHYDRLRSFCGCTRHLLVLADTCPVLIWVKSIGTLDTRGEFIMCTVHCYVYVHVGSVSIIHSSWYLIFKYEQYIISPSRYHYICMLIWIWDPIRYVQSYFRGRSVYQTYELVAISMYMKYIHLHFILYERHTYNHWSV